MVHHQCQSAASRCFDQASRFVARRGDRLLDKNVLSRCEAAYPNLEMCCWRSCHNDPFYQGIEQELRPPSGSLGSRKLFKGQVEAILAAVAYTDKPRP